MQEQSSILDFVKGGVDRLETKLGSGDRRKLTEYLDSIRDIERRIQKAEQQSASMHMPVMERPASAPDEFSEHAQLMMDLIDYCAGHRIEEPEAPAAAGLAGERQVVRDAPLHVEAR